MIEKQFIVTSRLGIHARPALELVKIASKARSEVKVRANNQVIDMKSIMGLMSLGMYKGQEFDVIVEGIDEVEAIKELTNHFLEEGLAKTNE